MMEYNLHDKETGQTGRTLMQKRLEGRYIIILLPLREIYGGLRTVFQIFFFLMCVIKFRCCFTLGTEIDEVVKLMRR